MKYELIESPTNPGHWHVEAFDDEGECIKAVFSGPDAVGRASEYRDWVNGDCANRLKDLLANALAEDTQVARGLVAK